MARIRTIKPEFWKDEDLSEISPEAHMLAAALLNYADDEGYFNANPKLVKAECSPLREDSVNTHEALTELSSIGYVRFGEGSNGRRYGHVVKFTVHQKINRPSPSKIAVIPITWDDSVKTHGALTEDSPPEQGTGNREQGTGKGYTAPSDKSHDAADTDVERDNDGSDDDPVFQELLLNDKTTYAVTESQVALFESLYPAVDVRQEIREMAGWLYAEPTKRKTRRGVKGFITRWLSKEQDRGGKSKAVRGRTSNTQSRNGAAAEQAKRDLRNGKGFLL